MHASVVPIRNKALAIVKAKNHDYTVGSQDPLSNFCLSAEILGIDNKIGLMLRMIDKHQRLRTFATKGTLKVANEGAQDAVLDLCNYTVLLAGLYLHQPISYETLLKLHRTLFEIIPDSQELGIVARLVFVEHMMHEGKASPEKLMPHYLAIATGLQAPEHPMHDSVSVTADTETLTPKAKA
jgi:hypothetical protein